MRTCNRSLGTGSQAVKWQNPIPENQSGVTFDRLFGQYLAGASKITITDPYLRMFISNAI